MNVTEAARAAEQDASLVQSERSEQDLERRLQQYVSKATEKAIAVAVQQDTVRKIQQQLEDKASSSELETLTLLLDGKPDHDAIRQELDSKANAERVEAALATKLDCVDAEAILAGKCSLVTYCAARYG